MEWECKYIEVYGLLRGIKECIEVDKQFYFINYTNISIDKYSKIKKEHLIKCSRDEIHFVMTISIYKERNTEYYMCVQSIEFVFYK